MEAIVFSSITQFLVGTAIASAMALASVGVIGSAVAQSQIEQAQMISQGPLINRSASPISETDLRLGDHQQLRKLFLGN
jgi:hypothetical protein